MARPRIELFLAICLACSIAPRRCPAQPSGTQPAAEGEKTVRLEFDPYRMSASGGRIESMGPTGLGSVALVQPRRDRADEVAALSEGLCLGLTGPRERPFDILGPGVALMQVEVRQIQPNGKAALRIARDAAARLRPGDWVWLGRPLGSTTAEMESLPGFAPLETTVVGLPGMASEDLERLERSSRQLKRVVIAILEWNDRYGSLPPAVVFGPDRKPWHSWRVLVLPYLDEKELFARYRFDEPWDGPNNRTLLDKMPSAYRDPSFGEGASQFTNYAVPVGRQTLFRPEGQRLSKTPPAHADDPDRLPFYAEGRRLPLGGGEVSRNDLVLVGTVGPEEQIPWIKPQDVDTEGSPLPGQPGGFAAPYRDEVSSLSLFGLVGLRRRLIRSTLDVETFRKVLRTDRRPLDWEKISVVMPADARGREDRSVVVEISRDDQGVTARLLRNVRF